MIYFFVEEKKPKQNKLPTPPKKSQLRNKQNQKKDKKSTNHIKKPWSFWTFD